LAEAIQTVQAVPATATDIAGEAARRRTFAIISHPDAGKTTLTEKLLLYGGAVNLAGSVAARRSQRQATSDWMQLERERGISITSTVLSFPYQGCLINLLDTPGHQDFSEDTYRTLTAADSAVMVLDAARGIEPQTLKLFDVCRRQGIPIFTFINKLDRPAQSPLELLDEIERVLGLAVCPMNWPIGDGPTFQGVYDRATSTVHRFERTEHGAHRAPVSVAGLDDPSLDGLLGASAAARLREDVELLELAGAPFDHGRVLAGELTPVFFGSALTNFGVQLFLDTFVALAPPPAARVASLRTVEPGDEVFSGQVFKIQANMDPRHRDRVAYLRVCSGRFERDMTVRHARTGRTVRLARPMKLFGQDRETVEEGYAGDVVGLINPGLFTIGDTVSSDNIGAFPPLPRFEAEHFARLENTRSDKSKQFLRGLEQIEEEGGIQLLYPVGAHRREPILAAVGVLQIDVVRFRLESEYGVETRVEPLGFEFARWVRGPQADLVRLGNGRGRLRCEDRFGHQVVCFTTRYDLSYAVENFLDVQFSTTIWDGDATTR
jgi:peptide chain release factor 3